MSLLIKVGLVLNVSLLHIKKYICVCVYILNVYIFLTLGVRIESIHSFLLLDLLECRSFSSVLLNWWI